MLNFRKNHGLFWSVVFLFAIYSLPCLKTCIGAEHVLSVCRLWSTLSFFLQQTEKPLETFTAVLAFSTIGLWLVTARAAFDSKRNMVSIERAYIFADFQKGIVWDSRGGVTVSLAIKNFGRSPAIVQESFAAWLGGAGSLATVPDYSNGLLSAHGMNLVIPHDIRETIAQFTPPQSDVEGHFYGYLRYLDMFHHVRESRFCIHLSIIDQHWETRGGDAWNGWD